jgi:hypothetical protein
MVMRETTGIAAITEMVAIMEVVVVMELVVVMEAVVVTEGVIIDSVNFHLNSLLICFLKKFLSINKKYPLVNTVIFLNPILCRS